MCENSSKESRNVEPLNCAKSHKFQGDEGHNQNNSYELYWGLFSAWVYLALFLNIV